MHNMEEHITDSRTELGVPVKAQETACQGQQAEQSNLCFHTNFAT